MCNPTQSWVLFAKPRPWSSLPALLLALEMELGGVSHIASPFQASCMGREPSAVSRALCKASQLVHAQYQVPISCRGSESCRKEIRDLRWALNYLEMKHAWGSEAAPLGQWRLRGQAGRLRYVCLKTLVPTLMQCNFQSTKRIRKNF